MAHPRGESESDAVRLDFDHRLMLSRRPPRGIVLDMDSSVSPTHGEQEMSVWNGHYALLSTRCSCSTSSATSNAVLCVPATRTALMAGTTCSSPSCPATRPTP